MKVTMHWQIPQKFQHYGISVQTQSIKMVRESNIKRKYCL
uniref:Uncharacterized protein n=1 Tax=Rhizophora mucronata TaxID=61149 RepID=A0A2P2IHR3_RHIMU